MPAITELAQQGTQDPRRWRILVVILLAQLMIVLDATVVNVALPSAQSALGFSTDSRQWIITAYTLAFGSMLLVGGKLGDIFGRKRTLVVGLCGFAIASAVGGAAPSFAVFVGARALQGAFAGLIAPAVLSLLSTTFTDPADRNKAFGIYGAVLISGASIGLLLGGALTEYIDWRAVMYINVVFAVLPVTGALKLLRNEVADPKPRLDVPGALAVSSGLFALVFAFSWAETNSWREPVTIALLVAGVLLLALFVGIESRVAQPLLPLRVLRDRNRGASYISMLIASAALFGVLIFLGYYLQQNEGYSPVVTGLAFLPMTLAVVVTSPTAQTKLRPRFGPRPLVVIGMLSGAAGMLYLSRVDVQSSYTTDILPALVALGVGLGLVFSSATNSGTLGVQPGDASVASATVNASQQIGASLGTALLSTLSASAVSSYLTGLRPTPAALAAASVHGYAAAFGWAALILAVGALIAGALYRRQVPERHPVAAPAVAH